ncbi:MATE family efflux transporter [Listeria grayi]|uniref:MATE family efflux transporter n=1 Tax=Listeria grayi TaxID=1641 RepID=UPI0004ACF860|nr:polysaccharide biosynthesis C-terminal domain-containing protein [Listeria grayi]
MKKKIAEGTITIMKLGVSLGGLLALLGLFIMPFTLEWIRVPADLLASTKLYCSIYLLGLPFIYLYILSRAILTCLGYAKHSFYMVLASSVLNLLFNLLSVGVLGMGVAGSAVSTVVAQIIFMTVSIFFLYKKLQSNSFFRWKAPIDFSLLKSVAINGLPSIFQQFVITLASLLLQSFVNPFGYEIIIGYLAVTRVVNLSRVVVSGFSHAFSFFSAQMLVQNRYKELKAGYSFITKISIGFTLLSSAVLLLFSKTFCQFFFKIADNPEGYDFFNLYMQIAVPISFLTVFKFMNESILRSAMEMREYLICNIGDLAIRIISTYGLIMLIGTYAFPIGELAARIVSFLLSLYFLYRLLHQNEKQTLTEN